MEPTDKDRDGKVHQIKVQVLRRDTEVRARPQFQYAVRTPNTWSRDVLMGRVLRSPSPSTQLPLRMTSYVYRDSAPGKLKLIMAAEIDPEAGDGALDLAMGFALFDQGSSCSAGRSGNLRQTRTCYPLISRCPLIPARIGAGWPPSI